MKKVLSALISIIISFMLIAVPVTASENYGMISDEDKTRILELLEPYWPSISENYASNIQKKDVMLTAEDIDFAKSYRLNIIDGDPRKVNDPTDGFSSSVRYEVLIGKDTYLLIDETGGKLSWVGTQYGGSPEAILNPEYIAEKNAEKFKNEEYTTYFVRINGVMMDVALTVDETGQKWVLPFSRFLQNYQLTNEYVAWEEYSEKITAYLDAADKARESMNQEMSGGGAAGSGQGQSVYWIAGGILLAVGAAAIFATKKNKRDSI